MYYEKWQAYDPDGTEFISYDSLFDFVDSLDPPLGITKPNRLKLISMDLVICKNNRIHCTDILDALTKNFLGSGDTNIEPPVPADKIKNDKPHDYEPITTMLQLKRQDYCARIITKAMRKYVASKKEIKLTRRAEIASFDTMSPLLLTPDSNILNEDSNLSNSFTIWI
jgi:hypothetical protein